MSCFPWFVYLVRAYIVYIMADVGDATYQMSEVDLKMETVPCNENENNAIDIDQESVFRPGTQLTDKQSFENRKGKKISGYPVIVDFRRLLQLTDGASKTNLQDFGIIPGVIMISSL